MKKLICMLIIAMLVICAVNLPVSADSATISLSNSSVTPGSKVTVTITYKASFAMYGIDISLKYNSSVLQYVSGGGNNTGSTVKIVEGLSGEKTKSFKVVFKAIANGSGSLSLSATASGQGDGSAKANATVKVAAAKPSSNANLGSLTIDNGTLTPEFSADKTTYTASVKNGVDKITISANAAMGDSRVDGVGTFDLKVGDNKNIVTVTAASGAKKTYTVNIKRMTEEETAIAVAEERKNNPYLFVSNKIDRYIVSNASDMPTYDGYTLKTVERKGTEVSYLADVNGRYYLVWTTDENGKNGAFYADLAFQTGAKNDVDAFEKVNCIKYANRLYIIEPFANDVTPGNQFTLSEYELDGEVLPCYKYKDEKLNGFYVFYCYADGKYDYYMLDAENGTVQREPTFLINMSADRGSGIFARLSQLSQQAKIVLALFVLAAIMIFVLVIMLVVRAFRGKGDSDENNYTIGEEETAAAVISPQIEDIFSSGDTVLDNEEPEDENSKNAEFINSDDF